MDKIKIILGASILVFSSVANAAVLFDNGEFSGTQVVRNNACRSFNDDGIGCRTTFTIYDNFVLSSGSVINSIVWHQTEQNPQNYLSTKITIFDGIPSDSTLIHTSEFVANRTLSLIDLPDPKFPSIPDPSSESLASVSGLNIALPAGTYWLGIHNEWRSSGASQWSQTTGNTATIPGRYQGESTNCVSGIIGPGGGCLNFFSNEDAAFKVVSILSNVVDIDIKPGSDPNSINPRSKGVVPVAVLGSMDFDATQVDFLKVTFGPGEASPSHDGHVEDVNDDGFMDMMFHFKTQETGIACGDADATLEGEIFDRTQFAGTDPVKTVGCNGSTQETSISTKGAGAMSWIFLVGLSVLGLWRRNR